MKKYITYHYLALISFVLIASSSPLTAQNENNRRGKTVTEYDAIKTILKSQNVTWKFNNKPLSEVVDRINRQVNFNFILSDKVKEQKDPDELRVTIHIQDLPLKNALKLLMNRLNLKVVYQNGVVQITTGKEARDPVIRIYDIRHLLHKSKDYPASFSATLERPMKDMERPDFGGSDVSNPLDDYNQGSEGIMKRGPQLLDVIKNHTGKDGDWAPGKDVSIHMHSGLLVVKQRPEVHKDIETLFKRLRRIKKHTK